MRIPLTSPKVSSHVGQIPDGEEVTFSDGKQVIGSAALSGGQASFTTSSLSVKKHTIKATYPGDTYFKEVHKSVVQVVEP